MSELKSVLTRSIQKEVPQQESIENVFDFSGKSVLLVEDNELNHEIAQELLEETGIDVDCAEDGIEAVNIKTIEKELTRIFKEAGNRLKSVWISESYLTK